MEQMESTSILTLKMVPEPRNTPHRQDMENIKKRTQFRFITSKAEACELIIFVLKKHQRFISSGKRIS
jgi:hypothetical protein